ncbi:hypothetical protein BOS5A_230196 [Bosea sp. EC-HK365B]|nr:hypothetical protein BOSE21B_90272 [Bosea sp. 21B]CAD5298513.1 hypothetical protein BOSE7B_60392 [Bosea sp. 7B]VVT60919.1 hypothetical protein BOS5A_230196 [Bosea sp. EC-HK365B]VXB36479.1 hypothetical protein BOSE127_110391 [Bosea sp. 127]
MPPPLGDRAAKGYHSIFKHYNCIILFFFFGDTGHIDHRLGLYRCPERLCCVH